MPWSHAPCRRIPLRTARRGRFVGWQERAGTRRDLGLDGRSPPSDRPPTPVPLGNTIPDVPCVLLHQSPHGIWDAPSMVLSIVTALARNLVMVPSPCCAAAWPRTVSDREGPTATARSARSDRPARNEPERPDGATLPSRPDGATLPSRPDSATLPSPAGALTPLLGLPDALTALPAPGPGREVHSALRSLLPGGRHGCPPQPAQALRANAVCERAVSTLCHARFSTESSSTTRPTPT